MILAPKGFTFFFPSNDMTKCDAVAIGPKKDSPSPNATGRWGNGCMRGDAEAVEIKGRGDHSHVESGLASSIRHCWQLTMGSFTMGHVFTVLLGLPMARPDGFPERFIFQ